MDGILKIIRKLNADLWLFVKKSNYKGGSRNVCDNCKGKYIGLWDNYDKQTHILSKSEKGGKTKHAWLLQSTPPSFNFPEIFHGANLHDIL